MAHQRQLIREAVKAQLLGKTAAGARVYETRIAPWRELELPALSVYALEESVDPASQDTAPRELTRKLQLVIQGAAKQGVNVDDALDSLALEIERALHADPSFGGTCGDSLLVSTELGIDEQGAKPVGHVFLTFTVVYRTMAPEAADVELPNDFATADIKTSLGGAVHPGNQAEDRVAVPTT